MSEPTTTEAPETTLAEVAQAQEQLAQLQEQIGALELALEDVGWARVTYQAMREFSKPGLDKIAELARVMYLKNPVIRRGVETKVNYVWGQGMTVDVKPPEVNAVVQAFLDDPRNQAELTSEQARQDKERTLETDGNLFLVLFTNQLTGRVRVRSVPMPEIVEIIKNPEDAREPWYYKRCWQQSDISPATGAPATTGKTAYYPDWRYTPADRPASIGGAPVCWDAPVFHLKVGAFNDWSFGISELYPALDWARAYKEFLEDVATLMRAYSRFAFKLTVKGGKTAVQAAKAKLGTTLASAGGRGYETNPPPTTASTAVMGEGNDLTPMNVRGASVAPEDGRRFLLMVAAALGLPETFFGDADVGNHATAKTLDRPTELQMLTRQTLWGNTFLHIIGYVLLWAVKAPQGALRPFGALSAEMDGSELVETVVWRGEAPQISVVWPPILQVDAGARIGAIAEAATLGGKALAGTVDGRTVSRLMLSTLGVPNIDEILDLLYPPGQPLPARPGAATDAPASPDATDTQEEASALGELRQAVAGLREDLAAVLGRYATVEETSHVP